MTRFEYATKRAVLFQVLQLNLPGCFRLMFTSGEARKKMQADIDRLRTKYYNDLQELDTKYYDQSLDDAN